MDGGIFYKKSGSGLPVVLLHGFPMHCDVWNAYSEKLSNSFTVYTPDLPGFGNSPMLPGDFNLQDVAERMIRWIKEMEIVRPSIIGHSMGGYVALEMVRKAPELFSGLGLFHSTAMADTPEKKDSRTKVIQFINENGVLAFTSNFIQPLFADQNHPAISVVREITTQSSAETVKGYTKAMRDRRDNRDVLTSFPGPVLIIGGDQDKGIPAETLHQQGLLNRKTSVHILPDTGHMGMFEKPEETLAMVRSFLRKIDQPEGA
jgi:pimeloyl-ACP methyl ester carboxylesterase